MFFGDRDKRHRLTDDDVLGYAHPLRTTTDREHHGLVLFHARPIRVVDGLHLKDPTMSLQPSIVSRSFS